MPHDTRARLLAALLPLSILASACSRRETPQASASQDPYGMGKLAVETGYAIMQGKKPENPMILMASHLVTRDNIGSYQGWSR
jgi:ribose transport system substrate-binding protein